MIRLVGLTIGAGAFRLAGVDLQVEAGEYAVLMGPTGSGKTTLLETVCGLRRAAAGRVLLDDVDVTAMHPAARRIGYVPQDGALFPTMRVRDQLGFAPTLQRASRRAVHARVEALAELLHVRHLLRRTPAGLSGGERQRVALGRALAAEPRVLLLDEPLSALDDDNRERMYEALQTACRDREVTTLHVTHNRDEARRLASRIFRLDPAAQPAIVSDPGTPDPPP